MPIYPCQYPELEKWHWSRNDNESFTAFQNKRQKSRAYLMGKGYTYLGEGGYREVFISPDKRWVVKLPKYEGQLDNWHEFMNYVNWKTLSINFDKRRFARTKFLELFGLPVVVMETLESAGRRYDTEEVPNWPEGLSLPDDLQVGKNRKGEWVVYDYADIDNKRWQGKCKSTR